jgi:hypothetical protein
MVKQSGNVTSRFRLIKAEDPVTLTKILEEDLGSDATKKREIS